MHVPAMSAISSTASCLSHDSSRVANDLGGQTPRARRSFLRCHPGASDSFSTRCLSMGMNLRLLSFSHPPSFTYVCDHLSLVAYFLCCAETREREGKRGNWTWNK